ncbi:hypothetical protein [Paenibacillus thalictri]|uniref:Uncharacterized protein n=1 Tax=Paenibacillus thalictri TaxID=2527873 RepID=A0A4Q9DPB9_9BACL|nr:hypothetical protein [Paenibacillus thalictri]TBL75630.1 hypothetical protein EYB31_21780 [Paenibacillus thalictri]
MAVDRQQLIDEFFEMIRKLNKTGTDIMLVRDFFWKVSEIRHFVPPTVEFLTVLRTYKPLLFHEFKSSLVPNSSISLLASVHMEAGQSLINLGITDLEKLQQAVKGPKK